MNLKEAATLLGANERYFTVVYEAFKFSDETNVRDYIDFIVRETMEWIKGFPLKLKSRSSFAKPKAALIKLLKTREIQAFLGAEYCSKAHDVVWDTFKKHGDDILNARVKVSGGDEGVDEEDGENELVPEHTVIEVSEVSEANDGIEEITDISGVGAPVLTPILANPWERKYYVLKSVVNSLLLDYHPNHGMANAINILISNLEHENA